MNFNDFSLKPHVVDVVGQCGFVSPTPIQEQSIPAILSGRDLLGLAQTGTGKTAAFLLPIADRLLSAKGSCVRTLILAPTRELAEQIHDFAVQVTRGTHLRSVAVYGGVSKPGQVKKLRQGVDIVVACPGRLLDILADGDVDLSSIEHLVLDEADHMFDQGFLPDIRRILGHLPKKRQTLVFSATMPAEIRKLAEEILHRPATVQIDRIRPADTVEHGRYSVTQEQKTTLLLHLLEQHGYASTLIFTRTKHRAKNLAAKLAREGYRATSLQGNLSQAKRQQALDGFKKGQFNILVATDIAARGIDVDGISHVINFDVPDTAEAYIHRSGRTGRALRSGEALTFATSADAKIIQAIERSLAKNMKNLEHTLRNRDRQPSQSPEITDQRRKSFEKKTAIAGKTEKRQSTPRRQNRSRSKKIFGLTA